jgi:hypothetical protein
MSPLVQVLLDAANRVTAAAAGSPREAAAFVVSAGITAGLGWLLWREATR